MGVLRPTYSFGLGAAKSEDDGVFSVNHFVASVQIPAEVQKKIASMGLVRAAGNVYECPSTRDFWKVKGNSIVKLVGDEVDNGESLKAAPKNHPDRFLSHINDEIEF